jgi:phosphotransferase system HPr (HPr) family protein
MMERRLTVDDPAGLHARQAARFVRVASRFESRITIRHAGREADAKSLIGILGLAVGPSSVITLRAEGDDAEAAMATLALELAATSATGAEPAAGPSSSGDG